ncbi:MAG: NUDIX domain-containing protein [Candidatus Latescibacteria bacterium]|nr:NUDIX domain-containing protein [Candidatus Latescibacterota bacterium]
MGPGRFLAGIGALIRCSSSQRYLFLKRAPTKDVGAGLWECVTGRVDQGEGFEEALHREVDEETGLAVQIDFIIGTSHFYRGPTRPDNELLGVTYSCSVLGDQGQPPAIRPSGEHSEYGWLLAEEALELLAHPDPGTRWNRTTLERAETIRRQLPSNLGLFYRRGFELNE